MIADARNAYGHLYGVKKSDNSPAENINLENNLIIQAIDTNHIPYGIDIQGDNTTLTARQLTVDVTGDSQAHGIDLSGKNVHANLGQRVPSHAMVMVCP